MAMRSAVGLGNDCVGFLITSRVTRTGWLRGCVDCGCGVGVMNCGNPTGRLATLGTSAVMTVGVGVGLHYRETHPLPKSPYVSLAGFAKHTDR
jgi:hypothetical protein